MVCGGGFWVICLKVNFVCVVLGVKAGIFVRDAKALCPQLIILPYNFEAYEEAIHIFNSLVSLYRLSFPCILP